MNGWMIRIERVRIRDDVDRLHVKIDKLNVPLVGFCFIRSIDNLCVMKNGAYLFINYYAC
jgi:hypothetical protein